MTPKDKAWELVIKYRLIEFDKTEDTRLMISIADAKQCALIVVDELLEATKRYDYTLGPNPSYNDYWLKVKYQIEHL
jgi:hypothetical protein